MSHHNGYILHEDSQRVVIATGFKRASQNAKTGKMIQIWILARHENPLHAIDTGNDSVICGQCPLRGVNGRERTCYVNVGQAPLAVWRAYQRKSYPKLRSVEVFRGRKVRFGAYGDPVFIPFNILRNVALASAGWTGYTHQWRNPIFAAYRAYLMASVETVEGKYQAWLQGWRTFRVVPEGTDLKAALLPTEIICPNTTRGITCEQCKLCSGASRNAKSILIEVHGIGKGNLAAAIN